jgi:hypothetical protein
MSHFGLPYFAPSLGGPTFSLRQMAIRGRKATLVDEARACWFFSFPYQEWELSLLPSFAESDPTLLVFAGAVEAQYPGYSEPVLTDPSLFLPEYLS